MNSYQDLRNPEYDFMVRIKADADLSNLKVFYVTNDSKSYTIVATTYEEALTVAGFEASATTKDSESSYQARNWLLTDTTPIWYNNYPVKRLEVTNLEGLNGT